LIEEAERSLTRELAAEDVAAWRRILGEVSASSGQ
jgi:hypothetical protein